MHRLYDFIETFVSVLVKCPAKEAVSNTAVADPLQDAKILTDISLDEIIIDPVTKLKITRRQWEAMGKGSKSEEVSRPSNANYDYESEKKPATTEHTKFVTFPPLPDALENKNDHLRKNS